MDYITIASTGNATDFGDDQVAPAGYPGLVLMELEPQWVVVMVL